MSVKRADVGETDERHFFGDPHLLVLPRRRPDLVSSPGYCDRVGDWFPNSLAVHADHETSRLSTHRILSFDLTLSSSPDLPEIFIRILEHHVSTMEVCEVIEESPNVHNFRVIFNPKDNDPHCITMSVVEITETEIILRCSSNERVCGVVLSGPPEEVVVFSIEFGVDDFHPAMQQVTIPLSDVLPGPIFFRLFRVVNLWVDGAITSDVRGVDDTERVDASSALGGGRRDHMFVNVRFCEVQPSHLGAFLLPGEMAGLLARHGNPPSDILSFFRRFHLPIGCDFVLQDDDGLSFNRHRSYIPISKYGLSGGKKQFDCVDIPPAARREDFSAFERPLVRYSLFRRKFGRGFYFAFPKQKQEKMIRMLLDFFRAVFDALQERPVLVQNMDFRNLLQLAFRLSWETFMDVVGDHSYKVSTRNEPRNLDTSKDLKKEKDDFVLKTMQDLAQGKSVGFRVSPTICDLWRLFDECSSYVFAPELLPVPQPIVGAASRTGPDLLHFLKPRRY